MGPSSSERRPNRLIEQKSPYLLQHAYNPVDWHPWGEEAFGLARLTERPIFLSVGYSTCHWCHVMERETFEDPRVAALLNQLFVNIKVDREECPDVDRVYMSFVQATSGHGGWPMSVWLTPELKPFFGGTYFPPDGRHGRPGFGALVGQLAHAWSQNRDQVQAASSKTLAELSRMLVGPQSAPGSSDPAPHLVAAGYDAFERMHDRELGGFGTAPKFPRPNGHAFLLDYSVQAGQPTAAEMVVRTLHAMANGGVHDQIGGGFHRYAVDSRWHVPHFEKMLCDQAQLAVSYLEGYQLSGDDRLADVARDTLDYVLCGLTDRDNGAFYSAEDADSAVAEGTAEQREGAFYVWSFAQLSALLGEELPLFCDHYGVRPEGNASDPHGELTGTNVLAVVRSINETAARFGIAPDVARRRLEGCRQILLHARSRRPRPHLDDKVITSWNALMISAFARGGRVLRAPPYLAAASRAADFLERELFDRQTLQLKRRYRAGEPPSAPAWRTTRP